MLRVPFLSQNLQFAQTLQKDGLRLLTPNVVYDENATFYKRGNQLHIVDYPDAAALVEIDDPRVPLLQSLSLHRVDLTLAAAALGYIYDQKVDGPLREILWY